MKKNMTATLGAQTTPAYTAPEIISNKQPSAKVDLWALGIILYQLVASMNHPFDCENTYAMIDMIKNNDPGPLKSTISPYIKQIIKELLEKNPEIRPDAQ